MRFDRGSAVGKVDLVQQILQYSLKNMMDNFQDWSYEVPSETHTKHGIEFYKNQMALNRIPSDFKEDFWKLSTNKMNHDIRYYEHVEVRQIHTILDLMMFCNIPDEKIIPTLYEFVNH